MRLSAAAIVSALAGIANASSSSCCPKTRNFIYIVPDGYGVASQVLARDYVALKNGDGTVNRPNSPQIGADRLVIGSVRTQSSDNLITDSAASGTAFSCGVKTYNGAIAVDDDGEPVASVLEAAYLEGYKTGLVVTSRITHATPACYASHVLHRDSENEIAGHEIGYSHPLGSVVDILMGGGRKHFLPPSEDGSRDDDVNLVEWAKEKGYTYVSDKRELISALDSGESVPLPFLGLFASDHLSYELDRDDSEQPSLLEMTKIALASLREASSGNDKGFFVMIEASRIDHAAHGNDAAGHVHDTVMYNEVLAYIMEYIDSHPDTQLLSAADHECGGLTLRNNYNPVVLQRSRGTTEALGSLFTSYDGNDKAAYLKDELLPAYGLSDISDDDVQMLMSVAEEKGTSAMGIAAGNLLATEAGLHWSTQDHSAADVLLHGYANRHDLARMRGLVGGNNDNTDLPRYIERILGLNLQNATEALRAHGSDWIARRDELNLIKRANSLHVHGHN
ncbi:related to alkaline phosphatase [Cephalotrichum gorgonifer]|uniref:Alkaline phosphatase n=1 Tax=Cephalotrichum gorgonifer TaxID=2041049 RepID=A0AAE8SZQ5_9PEZI|nr:related to alkaline phosphatase [Cephalotrichum gorgonifer]